MESIMSRRSWPFLMPAPSKLTVPTANFDFEKNSRKSAAGERHLTVKLESSE